MNLAIVWFFALRSTVFFALHASILVDPLALTFNVTVESVPIPVFSFPLASSPRNFTVQESPCEEAVP